MSILIRQKLVENAKIKKCDILVDFQTLCKGCLKPNCKQSTWNNFPHSEMWNIGKPGHKLCVVMSSMAKQIKRQEIRLCDFGTFLADVGSYLGLFLGASVLSISDNIIANLLSFKPFKV